MKRIKWLLNKQSEEGRATPALAFTVFRRHRRAGNTERMTKKQSESQKITKLHSKTRKTHKRVHVYRTGHIAIRPFDCSQLLTLSSIVDDLSDSSILEVAHFY